MLYCTEINHSTEIILNLLSLYRILMHGETEQKTVHAVSAAFVYHRVPVTQGQILPQYVCFY